MGQVISFLNRKKREGDELKKKYKESLAPSNLTKEGGNYVILNVASVNSNSESDGECVIGAVALTSGKRFVTLAKWKKGFHSEQIFKIEPCIDYGENCVVSCYGSKEFQWTTTDSSTQALALEQYPVAGEERLRPPRKKWRFRFEEKSPPGTKMYRIVSMDDDLDAVDCLALDLDDSDSPKLVFKRRKDDDDSQLWYLTT